MNDIEKIIEMLDKKQLNESELNWLKEISASDPELKEFIATYSAVKNSLQRNEHIDEELLAEYVLYKNNLKDYNKWLQLLLIKVEEHLRKCEHCQNTFRELNAQYADVDEFITKTISTKTEKSYTPITQIIFRQKSSAFRFAYSTVVALVVIYVALFIYSDVTTPDYIKTPFSENRDFYNTRGRTSELFQRGLDALDNNNYADAIKFLNQDLKENPDQESIFYTHFILGITYINKAEKDFLGLFKSFNKEDVLKGISHFEKSIELNQNDRFQNLKLDAHFYIGKAYLFINDKNSAKEHLQIVIDNKGSHYKDAEKLLNIF